jgi:hypothetical protein
VIQNFQRHDRQKGLFMQDSITHPPHLRATTATPTLLVTRVACWKVSSSVSAPVARRRESAANLLSVLMVAHMHSALELRTSSLDRRCPTRTFLGCTGPSHQSFRYVLARVLWCTLVWCGSGVRGTHPCPALVHAGMALFLLFSRCGDLSIGPMHEP